MATAIIYLNNQHVVRLNSLFRVSSAGAVTFPGTQEKGEWINSGSVLVTLYPNDDTTQSPGPLPVTGQVWPTALTYVPATNGNWEGFLEDDVVLTPELTYWVDYRVNASGVIGQFLLRCKAKRRVQ